LNEAVYHDVVREKGPTMCDFRAPIHRHTKIECIIKLEKERKLLSGFDECAPSLPSPNFSSFVVIIIIIIIVVVVVVHSNI
jgi:hypothetical protein